MTFLMRGHDDAERSLDLCRHPSSLEAGQSSLTGIMIVDQKPIRALLNGETDALLFPEAQL